MSGLSQQLATLAEMHADHRRYADYQQEPEEPRVGSPAYPAEIYGSWDPNWRGFVSTTLIMALEEFSHLLSNETQGLILQSVYHAAKGDEYRFGHLDPDEDNLYPAYSNPVGPLSPATSKAPCR